MKTTSPWINFNGHAEEAFAFYKSVFGGEFSKVVRFSDVAGPEFQVGEKEANKIMQIVLPLGASSMLMGNDVPEFMGTVSENENRSKIHLGFDNAEEARKVFDGLSAGGQVEVPMTEDPQGAIFTMFRDKYGIEWIVEYAPNA